LLINTTNHRLLFHAKTPPAVRLRGLPSNSTVAAFLFHSARGTGEQVSPDRKDCNTPRGQHNTNQKAQGMPSAKQSRRAVVPDSS